MILADKIVSLRKKAGWSQEELAQQLNVSRQSVSKWEGAQSMPDMDKVVQMSRIFGVSTDYLLKDELGEPEWVKEGTDSTLRRVTMEEASAYLALRKEAAPKMAVAVFLFIVSPVCLLFLGALSELTPLPVSENVAGGLGLCILTILVAVGTAICISCDAKARDFRFLEEEAFETEYGVEGMVRERMKAYADTYSRMNLIGTILCILSVIPLFLSICIDTAEFFSALSICILLIIVGIGCISFVNGGINHSAMEQLLQEGDYTKKNKARQKITSAVTVVYWLGVTAIFLLYSFSPMGNGDPGSNWFIWAVGGVLYAAVIVIVKLIQQMLDK